MWNLYKQKHVKHLERFALRMATKSWDCGYQNLLSMADITSLECRPSCVCCSRSFMTYAFFCKNMISTLAPTAICTFQCISMLICTKYCSCVEVSVINLPFQYFKSTINSYVLKVVYPAHVEPIALHYCISLFGCTLLVAYQHINQDGGCTFHGGIL